MSVKIKLSDGALIPRRQTKGSAGYDMYANENIVVEKGRRKLISTGVYMTIPPLLYGRIAPRSGLAVKKCIDIGAGIIDNDYTGEVKVLIINNGYSDFEILKGDRIAQIIFEQCGFPELEQVDELNSTSREKGGFGSTGR